jgi:hypothetical protein
LRRRIVLAFFLLAVMLTAVTLSKSTRSGDTLDPALTSARALWNERGSPNYRMTLVTSALPSPPTVLELTIQEGEIVQESIIPCDNPSEAYPEDWCEPTRLYYTWRGRYTIEQLFETARTCTSRTLISISHCPAYVAPEFYGFASAPAMFEAARTCQAYLQHSDSLCAVRYDATYGYPAQISHLTPGLIHDGGTVEVRAFEIMGA